MPFLRVEGINSFYGRSHILFDVSLDIDKGETVAILGRIMDERAWDRAEFKQRAAVT